MLRHVTVFEPASTDIIVDYDGVDTLLSIAEDYKNNENLDLEVIIDLLTNLNVRINKRARRKGKASSSVPSVEVYFLVQLCILKAVNLLWIL